MEVRDYEELKHRLCEELEEISDSKSFGMAEIEIIDKLIHSIKNIDKIQEMEGYSYAKDERMMPRRYSYAGREGTHYVKGHYSYDGETKMLLDKMQKMVDDSEMSLDDKSALTRAMDVLRK